ncbi:MAG: hypothetical protein QM813_21445 [Verrucomicrobiota bacterium]
MASHDRGHRAISRTAHAALAEADPNELVLKSDVFQHIALKHTIKMNARILALLMGAISNV